MSSRLSPIWCAAAWTPLWAAQDRASSAHGPDVVGVGSPHASKALGGGAGLRGPGRSVPLEDGVKEFVMLDWLSLNSPTVC